VPNSHPPKPPHGPLIVPVEVIGPVAVVLSAPGLESAIRDAGDAIAACLCAIAEQLKRPLAVGQLTREPQTPGGGTDMPFFNNQPLALDASWLKADGSPGTPDSVDWSITDASLGSIAPDPANPTGRAIYTPNAGLEGTQTFGAVAHQANFPDVTATPLTDNQVNPPNPIVSGTITEEPQGSATPVRSMTARGVARR
jgi:hypothetical protein